MRYRSSVEHCNSMHFCWLSSGPIFGNLANYSSYGRNYDLWTTTVTRSPNFNCYTLQRSPMSLIVNIWLHKVSVIQECCTERCNSCEFLNPLLNHFNPSVPQINRHNVAYTHESSSHCKKRIARASFKSSHSAHRKQWNKSPFFIYMYKAEHCWQCFQTSVLFSSTSSTYSSLLRLVRMIVSNSYHLLRSEINCTNCTCTLLSHFHPVC